MASPGDVAEAIGWGPIISLAGTIALALMGYAASNQRSRQTEADLEELKRDHGAAIKEAKASADQVGRDLIAYEKAAREQFVLTRDMERVERSLSAQISGSKEETGKKIEELRAEFGKKGIEHVVRNAITAGMAQVLDEANRRRGRSKADADRGASGRAPLCADHGRAAHPADQHHRPRRRTPLLEALDHEVAGR